MSALVHCLFGLYGVDKPLGPIAFTRKIIIIGIILHSSGNSSLPLYIHLNILALEVIISFETFNDPL